MAIDKGALEELKKGIPDPYIPKDETLSLGPAFQATGDELMPRADSIEPVEFVASLGDMDIASSQPATEAASQSPPVPSAADKEAAYEEYRKAVGEVHERASALTATLGEQIRGGDDYGDRATAAGFIAPTVSGHESAEGARNKREREKRVAMNQHMMLLTQLNNRLDGLYKERDYWQGEVEKYAKQEDAVEKYLEALRNGEDPDLSVEEQSDLDEAIRQYEEKYGVTVDRNDIGMMEAVLEEASKNKKDAVRKLDQVEQDIEETEALKQQIENDPDNPENTRLVQELENTLEGQEVSDKTRAELDTPEEQAQLDRAAGFADEEVARLAEATEDFDAFFASDDMGAIADQVGETPIQAAALKPEFEQASNPDSADSEPAQEIAAVIDTSLDKAPGAAV